MTWDYCSGCEREIQMGETAWTVNVNHESFDGETIDVLDAVCVLIFCEECAEKKDFSQIQVPPGESAS